CPRAAVNGGAPADAIHAATFHSQTQSQGCALRGADISRKTSMRKRRRIARKRREAATAARRQQLSRRDKGDKRENRAFQSGRCPPWRGRVDLPAACFNQYNVAVSPPDNQLNAVQRKLELRDAELKE